MRLWPEVRSTGALRALLDDENEYNYWASLFDQAYRGEIDTWDYQWLFSAWSHSMTAILPRVNLVTNIGFGLGATHTTGDSPFANLPTGNLTFPLNHPPFLVRNEEADHYTATHVFNCRHPAKEDRTMKDVDVARMNENAKIFDLAARSAKSLRENNGTEALRYLDEIIALSAGATQAHYAKAIALAKVGETEESVKAAKECLEKNPTHPGAKALLAELPSDAPVKRNEEKEDPDVLLDRAIECLAAERVSDALKIVVDLKRRGERYPHVDYVRALCFVKLDRLSDAREALKEELRYFPGNKEIEQLLSDVLEEESKHKPPSSHPQEFRELLTLIRPYSELSDDQLYSLYSAGKDICENNIPGNFVECGFGAGGASALLAYVIAKHSKQPRWLHCFDTFSGMPSPSSFDTHDGVAADELGLGTGTSSAPVESLLEIVRKLGVEHVVKYVEGRFEEVLPEKRLWAGMISLLHIDGRWFSSTKAALENLYDTIVDEGFLQVNGYGYWDGCRKAIDEFQSSRGLKFELKKVDAQTVWFKKPDRTPINPQIPASMIREFDEDDPVKAGVVSQMSKNERFQLYYAIRSIVPSTSRGVRFVEVGSYAGASLLLTCLGLQRRAIPFHGFAVEPVGQPQFHQLKEMLKNIITHIPKFSHPAAEELARQIDKDGHRPEFMFIDGDHSYAGVRQDILDYYPLLAPGGIIMFHDFLPPLDDENREAILFHHADNEPGIRQACIDVMEKQFGRSPVDLPLLYPRDLTQTQAHLPIIPGVYSTIRAYRKEG